MSNVVVTPSASTRLRRARPVLLIVILIVAMMLVFLLLISNGFNDKNLSINNPSFNGSRAIAQVLTDYGLEVIEPDSTSEALELMRANEKNDPTLLIFNGAQLSEEAEDAFVDLKRVVVVNPQSFPTKLTPDIAGGFNFDEPAKESDKDSYRRVDAASTPLESARAAGGISYHNEVLTGSTDRWEKAFILPGSYPDAPDFLYAELQENDTYRAVFASSEIFRNEHIGHFGNAALIINSLTAHSDIPIDKRGPIVVLHPSPFDFLMETPVPSPKYLETAVTLGFVAMCAWGISKGLRLGRLVPEKVPSYVPAAETVTGRGRLLYRNRETDHAARLLRLDSARRLAQRLGLPPSSSADSLRAALIAAGATPQHIDWLWPPQPTTDDDLVTLSEQLAALEKEIRP